MEGHVQGGQGGLGGGGGRGSSTASDALAIRWTGSTNLGSRAGGGLRFLSMTLLLGRPDSSISSSKPDSNSSK